ncbi:hypothetical protein DM860_003887 [Cuscuta australis]|uniref:Uncharacterized protein n=1 Tax=Cuscuta australis TaxID=267555 RepID=A0A328CUY3_9ASTE|nr:hypothetical protein DM860_003887 [Cuscuta australis]
MSRTRVNSGRDVGGPLKVLDSKGDRLTPSLKFGVLVLAAVSAFLALHSALTGGTLWFRRCPVCSGATQSFAPAPEIYGSIPPTDISHVVFGIGGSIKTWDRRKQYSELWWRPNVTRGFVWMDGEPDPTGPPWPETSPPYRVSSDWRRFKHTHSQSAVRLARIVVDSYRVGSDARWFVMGDDDTVFFPENLVAVLGKYDHREMYYVGGNSESVEQDTMHAYDMAFGGGGIAVSRGLAAELVKKMDGCLDRYFYMYGSDQRVWACVGELGVSLTRESGFHQMDIRGDPFGLLAAHPLAPLVSFHHPESVSPLFPNQTQLQSFKTIVESYETDPARTLQQSICYSNRRASVSLSWGYVVQIYPRVLTPKELGTPLQTFQTWRTFRNGPFTFNTRPVSPDPCEQPVVFYLDSIQRAPQGGTVTTYKKFVDRTQNKCRGMNYNRAFRFENVVVTADIMDHEELKQMRRRQCCDIEESFWSNVMKIKVRRCKPREALIIP